MTLNLTLSLTSPLWSMLRSLVLTSSAKLDVKMFLLSYLFSLLTCEIPVIQDWMILRLIIFAAKMLLLEFRRFLLISVLWGISLYLPAFEARMEPCYIEDSIGSFMIQQQSALFPPQYPPPPKFLLWISLSLQALSTKFPNSG